MIVVVEKKIKKYKIKKCINCFLLLLLHKIYYYYYYSRSAVKCTYRRLCSI